MNGQALLSERQITAILLIACGPIFTVGGILFTGRAIWKWPAGQSAAYLLWERGFVLAGLLINVLGFVLLEGLLRNAGPGIAGVIGRLVMVTYLLSAALLVVAETTYLHNREWVYPQIVVYVVVALLAQAAFGVVLLQTGLVAGWAAWGTIIWNLVWLAVLPIATPGNMYYPVLHHIAPLIIGIALLRP